MLREVVMLLGSVPFLCPHELEAVVEVVGHHLGVVVEGSGLWGSSGLGLVLFGGRLGDLLVLL